MLSVVSGSVNHAQKYQLPRPWDTAIESWTAWMRMSGVASSTIHVRRNHLRTLARRTGHDGPAAVTLNDLVNICGNQRWSNNHRKAVRCSLVGFFDWCVAQNLTGHNPATALPKVKEPLPNPRPVTDQAWNDLLAKAAPRERLMARLAAEAGMRRAEVAVAHRDDLLKDASGYSLIVHGKGGKQRVVPINEPLARQIEAHRPGEYLFPGIDKWGKRRRPHLSPHYVGKLVGDLLPTGWSMHKLRHRYATRGHSGTGNIRAVQECLGHVSVATTQKYVAVAAQDLRAVAEAAAAM